MKMGSSEEETNHREEAEKPTILLHRSQFFDLYPKDLSLHFTVLDPWTSSDSAESFLSDHAHDIRALFCAGLAPVSVDTLRLLPKLEVVVGSSVGVEHIDLAECGRRNIVVTNAGPAFSEDVADCAVAMLIDVLRRMSASDRYVRGGLWPKEGPYPLGFKVGGKRVGIVGLGHIGSQVASRLVPFRCKISYHSRNPKPSSPFPYYRNILDLAANSDILVLCCTLTHHTRHIINGEVMSALGSSGVIINVGRGALMDEKEMVRRLMKGELGGVGLDVFEDEPNVPTELFDLDNVVLSPHVAVLTPESFRGVKQLVVANLQAFFEKKPLAAVVKCE